MGVEEREIDTHKRHACCCCSNDETGLRCVYVCVCVCVWHTHTRDMPAVASDVCVCVCERERDTHTRDMPAVDAAARRALGVCVTVVAGDKIVTCDNVI